MGNFPAMADPEATILWLRRDLRLQDNLALAAALATEGPVLPVFVWSPEEEAPWLPGAASRWWLHHALADLDEQLKCRGSRLVLRAGKSAKVLPELAHETGARRVFWSRQYEPHLCARDEEVGRVLLAQGLRCEDFPGALLFEPGEIANQAGKPFQVFTAFWRACLKKSIEAPLLDKLNDFSLLTPKRWPRSVALKSLELLPRIPWDREFYETWEPTAAGAKKRLKHLSRMQSRYAAQRDFPAQDGTSRLSPYLHFGQISPRQAFAAGGKSPKLVSELGWREFAHHLLHHFPALPSRPMRAEFSRFPWKRNRRLLRAWQRGETGYPLVDAGMRELWRTGWMHNRARMVCASFLIKHLRQPWTDGAAWFWDTLVDADLANNSLGWQWVAGCGADAAPYFRVFNPVLQGERFDPAGDYVRRYVPELARLPDKFIHAPWRAPKDLLAACEVELGRTYPRPVVVHEAARQQALLDFQKTRKL